MRSVGIVASEVTADCAAGLGNTFVGAEIDLLVLDASPQSLDEDVVAPRSFAVHADGDARVENNVGEAGAGELAALIRIENLRSAVAGQSFLECLDAELRFHGDRQPPSEDPAAEPVDDRREIDKAPRHGDVGEVHRPDLVGPDDRQVTQEIRVNLMPRRRLRGVGLAINRLDPHALHQRGHVLTTADDR